MEKEVVEKLFGQGGVLYFRSARFAKDMKDRHNVVAMNHEMKILID
jgi:hypothetical protein